MLFNTWPYWIFFGVVLTGYFSLPERAARIFLILASLVFYGAWSPWFVALLLWYVAFNYTTGLAIGRSAERNASALLAFAVAGNLLTLGFFKYYAFVVGELASLIAIPQEFSSLRIILPVAISFYTFEAISYNVDVRRGILPAQRNLVSFTLFLTFFPRLVAGPIIRPAQFFPQVLRRRTPDAEAIRSGVFEIVKGLVKKMVFADNFALLADAYYGGQVGQGAASAAWIGTVAFAMQIYFDFSGYTDIARGCARLLGFELPPNFERPYLATDIAEFWRRWHMSLSSWLRDYLYIPLGGSRHGAARTAVNLLITMGLGGLWHGASWNFVLWGLYHGVLLCVHRLWRRANSRRAPTMLSSSWVGIPVTFLVVTLGWVPFRAPDFTTTLAVLGDLFGGTWHGGEWDRTFCYLFASIAVWTLLDRDGRMQRLLVQRSGFRSEALRVISLAAAMMSLELLSVSDTLVPFIYFQF